MISVQSLWFLFAGYLVMISFFVIQRLLRQTKGAKSLRGGTFDRGNMILIGSATGVGLWLPVIPDLLGIFTFRIDILEGLLGLALMLGGLGLRIFAARTLGKYYTTTLMMAEGQKVVSTGLYSHIRHPGYLGEIFLWSGFGILSSNLIAAVVLPVMFIAVLLYRISSEEKMLVRELGDSYSQYQRRTSKLIPHVF
jgi:protein-S-isoprenylcysteine O-methyltransferase Ste14